jgi:hypothetical protein
MPTLERISLLISQLLGRQIRRVRPVWTTHYAATTTKLLDVGLVSVAAAIWSTEIQIHR